jgi:hypothetical protein
MKPISSMGRFARHELIQQRTISLPELPLKTSNLPFLPQKGHGSFLSSALERSANWRMP